MGDSQKSRQIASAYLTAKSYVLTMGFEDEIGWQESLCLEEVTEQDFMREAAWVILCSGMRERVIRRIFPSISSAFSDWESTEAILSRRDECQCSALQFFRHERKIAAIFQVVEYLASEGIAGVRRRLKDSGPAFLERFSFIGPATSLHLAKNLGLMVAKPDRHLVRIASNLGYGDIQKLCSDIARITLDSVPVVDLVLWRYATLEPDYLSLFITRDDHSELHTSTS